MTSRYVFSYEAETDLSKDVFNLALTFPVVGEKVLAFNFDQNAVRKSLKSSGISSILLKQFGNRSDLHEVTESLENFLIFSAEFMKAKAYKSYPNDFGAFVLDNNYYLEKRVEKFVYQIEASSLNEKYFERLKFKIYNKSNLTNPILTLFLILDSCDER